MGSPEFLVLTMHWPCMPQESEGGRVGSTQPPMPPLPSLLLLKFAPGGRRTEGSLSSGFLGPSQYA